MDILKELQDTVERNLPAIEAKRLRTYIDEAEHTKATLAMTQKELAQMSVQRDKNAVEAATHAATSEQLRTELRAIRTREGAIADAEKQVLIANMNTEKANAVGAAIMSVVGMFTKNVEVRRSINTSGMAPTWVPNNGGSGFWTTAPQSNNESVTETTE